MLLPCHFGWHFTWSHDSIDLYRGKQEAACPLLGMLVGRFPWPHSVTFSKGSSLDLLSFCKSFQNWVGRSQAVGAFPLTMIKGLTFALWVGCVKSEDNRKVLSYRSLNMHPLLTISTFSALSSRGFPCFLWILRSRDPTESDQEQGRYHVYWALTKCQTHAEEFTEMASLVNIT